jgi:DNA-binding HxlR family transcriptional regulator
MSRRKGYGQFCPVAKAAEVVAERWTPLILRELLLGTRRFNDLRRGVPLCSPSLLSARLTELEDAGVVKKLRSGGTTEYELTVAGEELRPIIEALGLWGHKHVQHAVTKEDLDPTLLMWDVRRRVNASALPAAERTVVRFELTGVPRTKSRWWLVFDGDEVDLCLKSPGYEVDLDVTAHVRTLTETWVGHQKLGAAIRSGAIALDGPPAQVRAFPKWFALSHFADAPRS